MPLLWLACATVLSSSAIAQSQGSIAALDKRLEYQRGVISLGSGLAMLTLPENFRYVSPVQTGEILAAWGNPPGQKTLGMIVPAGTSPLTPEGWGVIITYDADGYVKDDDAATIDYDKLLRDMQQATREENKEREKGGYSTFELAGWAEPPHYDQASHKLFWAKELRSDQGSTLNYNIRVLGRKGVLVLNAVAAMDQIESVRRDMTQVLSFAEFNPGNRYADFTPGSDHVAEYGIAALVAGGIAAKAGLFKGLIALLIAGKKLLVVAVVGIGAWLKRMFGKKTEPAAATPATPAR